VQRIARINSPHATSPLDSSSAGVPTAERLSAALSRASKIGDHLWAEARDIDIPLTLETRRAGTYSYELQSVVDACGNQVDAAALAQAVKGQPAPMAKHEVVVHARARIAFQGCFSEQPKKLLRGETNGEMTLRADGEGAADDGWSALVRFEPTWVGSEKPITRAAQNVSMGTGGIAKVPIEGPGEYIIEAVQGAYCAGEVSTPRVCRVIDVPQPRANITFHAIQDQCAGPVGARALAVLSGTPPFKLEYSEQRKGQPEYARERVVQGTRDEIELRPNSDGDITYRFKRLSDANYKQLALDGPEFTQSVHPLATARFAGSTSAPSRVPGQPHRRPGGVAGRQPARTIVLRSCDGNRAAVDVEFSGVGPFALTYATRVADDAAPEQKVLEGLTGKSHTLDLDLPERLSTQGGLMTLSLVSIRDSRGCERPLAEADVVIEVRRTKPSAGFDVPSGQPRGQINVLEGQDARLPVRLTGEGPWQVEVQRQGDDGPPITETLRSADAHILARKAGRYTLVSVKDSTCPGSVVPGQDEFDVTLIPRPSARFDDSAGHLAANSSLLRAAVCVGRPDSVDVRLTGHSPLSLSYALSLDGRSSQSTISSAQGEATLPLSTTSAGWHTYELVNIGDQLYAPAHLPRGAAASSHAVLHQMVYPAPVASFVETRSAASLCVGDSLSSAKIGPSVPTISLVGTPPFAVDFSVGEATESVSRRRVFHREGVQSHSLVVELSPEELSLDRVGRWTGELRAQGSVEACTDTSSQSASSELWTAMAARRPSARLMPRRPSGTPWS
jgi:nucleoporin POM152